MKLFSLLIAVFALVLTQCERHSWEDVEDEHGHVTEKGTKRLFEVHGGEDGAAHGTTGAGHDQDAEAHGTEDAGHDADAGKDEDVTHDHDGDGQADH